MGKSEKELAFETFDDDSIYRNDSMSMASTQVVGTTNLYKNGQIRYVPMPTPDPKGSYSSRDLFALPHRIRVY